MEHRLQCKDMSVTFQCARRRDSSRSLAAARLMVRIFSVVLLSTLCSPPWLDRRVVPATQQHGWSPPWSQSNAAMLACNSRMVELRHVYPD